MQFLLRPFVVLTFSVWRSQKLSDVSVVPPGNCKFLHKDLYTSYPKYGRDLNEHHKEKGRNIRSMKVSNSARPSPRSSHSIKTSRPDICYNFRDNGYCSFGSRCKFNHISI